MPSFKQMLGVKGDECQCGRRATIRHCTSCGSCRIYARQRRLHKFIDGSARFVEIEFRCQACAHLFVDEERALCEAPPVGQVLASQRVRAIYEAKRSGEYLSPTEVKIANALDVLSNGQLSKEQREEAEAKLDTQLRTVWSEMRLLALSGKGEDPGNVDAFIEAKRKEFRINDKGEIEQVQP